MLSTTQVLIGRLHTHTGKALPSETRRTNILGMGRTAGLPRSTTGTLCVHTKNRGSGDPEGDSSMRNTLGPHTIGFLCNNLIPRKQKMALLLVHSEEETQP